MLQKYKHTIIIGAFLLGFSVAFYFLYGILISFILGLLLAYSVDPLVIRIQKKVKNRNLATTLFLATTVAIIAIALVFLGQYINRDFKRLSSSFSILISDNEENLDKTAQKAKEYLGSFYDFDELESELRHKSDSLMNSLQQGDTEMLDTESITAAFEEIAALFPSSEETISDSGPKFGFMFIFSSAILYFVLILYQIDYFVSIRQRYFSGKARSKVRLIIDDINQSFVRYFKLRSKIVLLLSFIYITAFLIMDMPGMILITALIMLLSFIPYLQYLALIPLAVGCLVVSVEFGQSYLLIFGIVVGVFILASIIEELVLTPWIMEKNIGMNPVIMILALSVWGELLGLRGLIVGIPMTGLLIIYFKRYVLTAYEEKNQDEN